MYGHAALVVALTTHTLGRTFKTLDGSPHGHGGCNHSVGKVSLGIRWLVLAMFAPDFVTGKLLALATASAASPPWVWC